MADTTGAVVVGIDGSDIAIAAARWAGAVATRIGAPLHIVHAMPSLGRNLTDAAAAIRAAIMSYQADSSQIFLADAADAVRAAWPDLRIDTESHSEPADRALIVASRTARLIVLGGNELSAARALLLGSTTLAVATHAHCPVVAWRGGAAAPGRDPIVVGVDGSAHGQVALEAAFELAEAFDVPVRAVRSWTAALPPGAPAIPFVVDWEALEAAQLTELVETVDAVNKRHPGVRAECHLEHEGPARALLQHAATAQLIVVGTRGRNALAGALLGSTSLNLLQHSTIPVMVCHAEGD